MAGRLESARSNPEALIVRSGAARCDEVLVIDENKRGTAAGKIEELKKK